MGNKIYMLRSAEPVSEVVNRNVSSELDFLSPLGEAQARLASLFFKFQGIEFSSVYASPALKARHTTSIILSSQTKQPAAEVTKELSELTDWCQASAVQDFLVGSLMPSVRHGNVLVVSHYYVLRAMFKGLASSVSVESGGGKFIGHGGIFVWDVDHVGRVLSVNPNVHYATRDGLNSDIDFLCSTPATL